jgi:hypothetical protein
MVVTGDECLIWTLIESIFAVMDKFYGPVVIFRVESIDFAYRKYNT